MTGTQVHKDRAVLIMKAAEAERRRRRKLRSTMKVPDYSLEASRAGFVFTCTGAED